MQTSTASVSVIPTDLSLNPKCAHGPMILFGRRHDGELKTFYACSACRDRRECSAYVKSEDWQPDNQAVSLSEIDSTQKQSSGSESCNILRILRCAPEDRAFCRTCAKLLTNDDKTQHLGHEICQGVTNADLTRPSQLLPALTDTRKEAQYHFTERSVEVIVSLLKAAGIKNVISIGAPRIHEHVLNNESTMRTLLLDFDSRYKQFFPETLFCHYNMFNHHFFDGPDSEAIFQEFLADEEPHSVAIVTDPPFAGRVELVAQTLVTIQDVWQEINTLSPESNLPILWIFPYFMEPHIKAALPHFAMLDYKVGYTNHLIFKTDENLAKRKKSPVRIFTSIDSSLLPLPEDEGYRLCTICKRWVAAENQHCKICNLCTSKDGKTYVHCATCRRCVKPTWVHCNVCSTCALPEHPCGKLNQLQGCRKCGDETHNWRQCPQLVMTKSRTKRKDVMESLHPVEKKLRATTRWVITNL